MTPLPSTGFRFIAPMPRLGRDVNDWVNQLRHIEDSGYHAVAISEHFSGGWSMEALTTVAFAAANTTRLKVLPLVLNNDFHNPARLAKAIATADVLSGGRVMLGLGAGWLADDYPPLGVDYESASVRVARLAEAVEIYDRFFAEDVVTFTGTYYRVAGLESLPKPVQQPRPPLLLGAGGPRMLRLAGEHADIVGIHPQMRAGRFDVAAARDLARDGIKNKIDIVAAAAQQVRRPQPELQYTCFDVNIAGTQLSGHRTEFTDYISEHQDEFTDTPGSLRGSVDKCVDDLVRWRDELGITYWNLGGDLTALAPIVNRLA